MLNIFIGSVATQTRVYVFYAVSQSNYIEPVYIYNFIKFDKREALYTQRFRYSILGKTEV